MKFKKLPADSRIFHGTSTQLNKPNSSCPRLMFMYFGNKLEKSFAALRLFADIFTPRAASMNANPAKKRQDRLVLWETARGKYQINYLSYFQEQTKIHGIPDLSSSPIAHSTSRRSGNSDE
jgi:hypothetical protein